MSAGSWTDVPMAPLDPILGMSQRFQADTDERKVNVSIGAYRTDEGKPLVLNCVKNAELLTKRVSLLKRRLMMNAELLTKRMSLLKRRLMMNAELLTKRVSLLKRRLMLNAELLTKRMS